MRTNISNRGRNVITTSRIWKKNYTYYLDLSDRRDPRYLIFQQISKKNLTSLKIKIHVKLEYHWLLHHRVLNYCILEENELNGYLWHFRFHFSNPIYWIINLYWFCPLIFAFFLYIFIQKYDICNVASSFLALDCLASSS